jgi:ubiquinone/menaquinone biosynthesis C-methylase UbiE
MILGNGEYLPINSKILSGLICISVFHYFCSPGNVLSEFSRLLGDEGVYVYGDLTLHEQDTGAFFDRLERSISHAHATYFTPSQMKSMIEDSGIRVEQIETIQYQKSYNALIQDKAQYFGVNPSTLHDIVINATEQEKELYGLEKDRMTLYYTLMTGTLK